jgi:hypothetical protein
MTLTTRAVRITLAALLLATAGAGVAAAQSAPGADPAFARMRDKLRQNDRVTVTLVDGSTVKGRVLDVSSEALSVQTDVGGQQFTAADVDRVQRHRRTMLLGGIIGTGVGLVCGLALAQLYANEGNQGAGAVVGLTAVGLGAGIGIDAAVNFPHTVYKRSVPRSGIRLDAGPRRTAMAVTIAF